MANIVCITSGLTGILHASFELVMRLENDGHRLTCASPAAVAAKVEAQGLRYRQLPELTLNPEPVVPSFGGPLRKMSRWWYKWHHRDERRRKAVNSIGSEEVRKRLEDFAADLLIIDVELHEYIMVAYSGKMPFVLLSQWFSLWPAPGLPYLLSSTIPGQGWAGRHLSLRLSWWWVRRQRWWMFTKKRWLSLGTDRRSALLETARQLGFPRRFIRENYWPGPFTYRELPVISMTTWEMEFPHQKRQHLHYVGPMVFTDRKEVDWAETDRERLTRILESPSTDVNALIYCSVSSLKKGDARFLQKVISVVGQEATWSLVMGLGGLLEEQMLRDLPPNVHVFRWVPQLQVLERADCCINHGGIHTINECLHYQVPMLVYSGKRSDQNGCAARVAFHEIGLVGDKDEDSVDVIYNKIQRVLSDRKYRRNMEAMHRHYLHYKTEKRLENIIRDFLD